MENTRGQCCDSANNLVGIKSGNATQILKKSLKAFLIHCFVHALNLSGSIMYTTLEISNLPCITNWIMN